MKKISFLAIVTTALVLTSPVYSATAVWEKEFTDAPAWQQLTNDGNLLVSAEDKLAVFRGTTGDMLWERSDLWATSSYDVRMLGNSGLLLAEPMSADQIDRKKKRKPKRKKGEFQVLTAVDILSGEDYWVMDFLRGEIIDIRVLNKDEIAFVFQAVSVKSKEESGIYITAINLADGKVLWETQYADRRAKSHQQIDVRSRRTQPYYD